MVVTVGRLLEREAELERIGGDLDGARDGTGALLVLTGAPGIGKTRLARATRDEAEERGFHVLSARGAELERDYAFGVVRQWFEPLFRSQRNEVLLEGAAALAAPVLGGDAVASHDPTFSALHGLYWVAAGVAECRPLALILDDAQWSDAASLRFLGFLARRLDGLPLLLLITGREPVSGLLAELAADPSAEVLALQPLGTEAVAGFLRDRAPGVVEDAFALACQEATGGNPFLLEELTRALLAEGIEFVAAERGRVPAVGPRSVATSVLLRLARLPADATALARAAAAAGDDAPLPLVATLAGLDESGAAAAADALAAAGVVDDVRPLRFVHPIVRAAIHESLPAGERETLHARAADLLAEAGAPAEAVAVHLHALEPRGDHKRAATLAEAARNAMSRGAPEAAATLFTRALAEPPRPDERPGVLLGLGRAEHALERPNALEHLREAHRLATDLRTRARAALLLTWAVGSGLTGLSDHHELLELLERAINEATHEDRELALELEAAWMSAAWDSGLIDSVLERGERFADLEGRTPGECLVLAHLAHVRMDAGRSADDVAPLAERAAAAEFVPDLGPDSIWALHTGIVLRQAERIDAAVGLLNRAIVEAQTQGSLRGFVVASMFRSAVLHRAGDIAAAEADARAALAAAASEAVFLLPAVAQVVDALIEQGRLEEACGLLERYGFTGALPDVRHGTVLLFSRSWLRAERGDHAHALADLAEARRRLDRVGRLNIVGLDGRVRAALIHLALGDTATAEQEADVAVEAARSWGTPGAVGTALRGLGLVHGDLEILHQAVHELARSPLRLDHARALVDLGAALRRAGRRSEARGPLREALALADECGGIAVRERAREVIHPGSVGGFVRWRPPLVRCLS